MVFRWSWTLFVMVTTRLRLVVFRIGFCRRLPVISGVLHDGTVVTILRR